MFDQLALNPSDGQWIHLPSVNPPNVCSDTDIEFFRLHLQQNPATFTTTFHSKDLPSVSIEWQSVFLAVGVAYIQFDKQLTAVSLLLGGQHSDADMAAIDALQSILAPTPSSSLRPAFHSLRRHKQRPLHALFHMRTNLQEPQSRIITLASTALSSAFFASDFFPQAAPSVLLAV